MTVHRINFRPAFRTRIADCDADLCAAQRVRYAVFVTELGGDGAMVDHFARQEIDAFDAHAHHLLLEDLNRAPGERVVGTYRLMDAAQARSAGGFYSSSEYDLAPLLQSGRRLLELGRSCVLPAYRGGTALFHLWQGLAAHVSDRGTELLFGAASFHGTDATALAQPLSYLYHFHRAAPELRVKARGEQVQHLKMLPPGQVDRKAALAAMPPLIKAYLRMGAVVGDGAFVDHAFNTTDVSLIVDVMALSDRQKAVYSIGARG